MAAKAPGSLGARGALRGAELLTLQEDGVVEGWHGQRRQGRGRVEVGGQPGRTLRQGLHHLPGVVERLARGGGR